MIFKIYKKKHEQFNNTLNLKLTDKSMNINWDNVYMDFIFKFKITLDTKNRWGMESWGDGFSKNGYSLEKIHDRFDKIKSYNYNSIDVYIIDNLMYGYFHIPDWEDKNYNFERKWLLVDTKNNYFVFSIPDNRDEYIKIKYKDFFAALDSKSLQWNQKQ